MMSDIFHEAQFKKINNNMISSLWLCNMKETPMALETKHENYNYGQRVKAHATGMLYTRIAKGPG